MLILEGILLDKSCVCACEQDESSGFFCQYSRCAYCMCSFFYGDQRCDLQGVLGDLWFKHFSGEWPFAVAL